MDIADAFKEFAEFLRGRKVVKTRELLVEQWDPTYGRQEPSFESVDVVDMAELCRAIDEFGEMLRKRHGDSSR